MPGSRDDGQGYQQYNSGHGSNDYDSYGGRSGGGGGGGYRDRGYGRQNDRYGSQDRYDSKPAVNESGIHRIEDTVYISNLPQEVTEEKLAEHFGSIGIIKTDKKLRKPKIWIYVDKTTNLPKGDATLTYDDPPSADAAIEWFGGKEFMGNVIQVTKAERKMTIPPERGSGGGGGGYDRRGGGGGGRGGFRDQHGGGGGRGGGGMGNREPREGDWTCDGCGANNFSRRDECFKCHASRPGGSGNSGSRSSSSRGDRSGGGGGYRGGSDRSDSRRDRHDDRSDSRRDYNSGRGGRDDYRKDNRHERRDRPY
ncbi:hypothetical protein MAM1_0018d01647 [Mucor ambiguus]|uniref:RNA-binding domain-containing protein n=1 Tax=Mucor ambiguus TaxID=91626 RepID=A0A0C9M1E2_9FUNG|nr:hypothetical protein MAM1_0018d01647 [Mucor ambiguus]